MRPLAAVGDGPVPMRVDAQDDPPAETDGRKRRLSDGDPSRQARGGPRVIVVTASNSNQLPLLRNMITTLTAQPESEGFRIACLDLGLSVQEIRWLESRDVMIAEPWHRFELPNRNFPRWMDYELAQPFLREILPGWDIYFWIDADVWFQDGRAIGAFVNGAMQQGLALATERTPMYRVQPWLLAWMAKHFYLGFGAVQGSWLLSRQHFNSGVFAMHRDAPHWAPWAEAFGAAIRRSQAPNPHGQFSLNQLVHGRWFGAGRLGLAVLEPWANWICDRGVPMWNDATRQFCEPRAPFRAISALHLAGPGKFNTYAVRRTEGGSFQTMILPGASPEAAPKDRVLVPEATR